MTRQVADERQGSFFAATQSQLAFTLFFFLFFSFISFLSTGAGQYAAGDDASIGREHYPGRSCFGAWLCLRGWNLRECTSQPSISSTSIFGGFALSQSFCRESAVWLLHSLTGCGSRALVLITPFGVSWQVCSVMDSLLECWMLVAV